MGALVGSIVRAVDHASDPEALSFSLSLLIREFHMLGYSPQFIIRGLFKADASRPNLIFESIGSPANFVISKVGK